MYKGKPFLAAPALQIAKETPKIAFAPSLDLFGVPSSFSKKLSISVCCVTSKLALKIKVFLYLFLIIVKCYITKTLHLYTYLDSVPLTIQEQW